MKRDSGLQRGILILPSAFTLANLFFGLYAIVLADRGNAILAAWLIVFAAITDNLDGRIARFTRTGSRFGAELDSLVDAISFGVAPAYLMYAVFFSEGWGWLVPFTHVAAVVIRLARFNIEQGGKAHKHFLGLPSPSGGMLLATFYPFSQTPFFQTYLQGWASPEVLATMVVMVSVLMLSHVPYAVVPRINLRSWTGALSAALMAAGVALAITVPRYYFFPALAAYTLSGLLRSFVLGLLDRLPDRDPLLDQESVAEAQRPVDYESYGSSRRTEPTRPADSVEDLS
ncbi:MAG: CDP-diacylglycerol--serine O-phosphatidyltransferase [Gemmatimonadota bacterium]